MSRRICFALLAAALVAAAADFIPLFDGKTTQGWTFVGGKEGNWVVEDGHLVTKGAGGGWISTDKEYANFVLQLEYKLQAGGNSGVFLRSPHEGDPAYTGMEIQILDDDDARYAKLQPFQYCGSLYGVVAAKRGSTKKPGEWNSMEITANGPKITIKLNGTTITEANVDEHPDAVEKHPGLKRKAGYIGLQSHSEPVEFRNVRIQPLP